MHGRKEGGEYGRCEAINHAAAAAVPRRSTILSCLRDSDLCVHVECERTNERAGERGIRLLDTPRRAAQSNLQREMKRLRRGEGDWRMNLGCRWLSYSQSFPPHVAGREF